MRRFINFIIALILATGFVVTGCSKTSTALTGPAVGSNTGNRIPSLHADSTIFNGQLYSDGEMPAVPVNSTVTYGMHIIAVNDTSYHGYTDIYFTTNPTCPPSVENLPVAFDSTTNGYVSDSTHFVADANGLVQFNRVFGSTAGEQTIAFIATIWDETESDTNARGVDGNRHFYSRQCNVITTPTY